MKNVLLLTAVFSISLFLPELGICSVEASLSAIQNKLITTLLPLAGIIGLCFAAFSFFTGSPNAKNHLWLAIIGAAIGFGAPSIISFMRSLIQ